MYSTDHPENPEPIYIATHVRGTNLEKTSFDPQKPSKVIIHGYNSNMFLSALTELRKGTKFPIWVLQNYRVTRLLSRVSQNERLQHLRGRLEPTEPITVLPRSRLELSSRWNMHRPISGQDSRYGSCRYSYHWI